jgi:hypothetical protein
VGSSSDRGLGIAGEQDQATFLFERTTKREALLERQLRGCEVALRHVGDEGIRDLAALPITRAWTLNKPTVSRGRTALKVKVRE